jgi:hypothetical protein
MLRIFHSQRSVFLRKALPLFFVFLFVVTGIFSGCDLDGGDPPSLYGNDISQLIGSWADGAEGYEISNTTLSYDDGSNGAWGMSFDGIIRYVANFSAKSGVIIIEYTAAPTVPYTASNNFLGIYYRIETANMVKFANSYNASTNTPNLNSAVATFTLANESDFVSVWGSYIKQSSSPPPVDVGFLKGNWYGDDYTAAAITDTTYTHYMGMIDLDYIMFAGTIEEVTDTEADSGYIYIKLTNADMPDGEDLEIGNYYAIHWKNKASDGKKVEFCWAYDDTDITDFDAAKTEFVTNEDDYYFDDGYYELFGRQ